MVNSGLAVSKALVYPLDIAQKAIINADGQPETIIATDGGVADVEDTIDSIVVGFIRISAPGYRSATVAPMADKPTIVYLTPGSDQAPPRRPNPAIKPDTTSAGRTNADALMLSNTTTSADADYQVNNAFMKYHLSMKWAVGILFIGIVALCVFISSKNNKL